jgi:uncharacterized protein (TIGR03067 family)
MRRISLVLLLAWTPFVPVLADAPHVPARTADGEQVEVKLQGRWQAIALEFDGEGAKQADVDRFIVVVKGRTMTFFPGTEAEKKATIRCDGKSSPKAIDFTVTDKEKKEHKMPGIYSLERGQLRLCVRDALEENGRPTAFKTEPNQGMFLATFKRVKE